MNLDFLKPLENKIEDIEKSLEHRAKVAALRELSVVCLSRLITLDQPNLTKYQAAIDAIQ